MKPLIEILPLTPTNELAGRFGTLKSSSLLKVVRFDSQADIAELSIPKELRSSCRDLADLEKRAATTPRVVWKEEFVASGFHGQAALSVYTGGIKENGFIFSVLPRLVSTSLTSLESVIEIPHLEMTYGLSGGATVGRTSGALLGINKSFVPFQGRTFAIPTRSVLAFLKDTSKVVRRSNSATQPDGNGKENGGENSGAHGGENSGAHGGENSGAHGGENSGAHGGENSGAHGGENSGAHGGENSGAHGEDQKPVEVDSIRSGSLSFLREPNEGVSLGGVMKRRLLFVGGNQIDGFDDLRENQDFKIAGIWFGDSTFTSGQKSLMERLSGTFVTDSRWIDQIYGVSGSSEKLIVKTSKGYRTLLEGRPKFQITIQSKARGFLISLHRASYDLHASTLLSRNYYEAITQSLTSIDEIFIGQYSSDGKQLFLQHNGKTLRCENINYLKLICSSQGQAGTAEEFSISRKSIMGEISFRHSFEKIDDEGHTVIVYRYGRAGALNALK